MTLDAHPEVRTEEPHAPPSPAPASSLGFVWTRKWLVLLGLVAGLAVGGLYYARCRPTYESTAQVLVIPKHPATSSLGGTGLDRFEDYASTHVALIRSPLIVSKTLKTLQGKEVILPSLAGVADPTSEVIRYLKVSRDAESAGGSGGSTILNLSYRGPVAADCGVILNAIIDNYRDFLETMYKDNSDDTLNRITAEVVKLQESLKAKEKAYQEFREKTPSLAMKGKGVTGLSEEQLGALSAEKSRLVLRRTRIKAHLAEIDEARRKGAGHAELLALVKAWSEKERAAELREKKGDLTSSVDDQLIPLLLEEKALSEDFGPDHPKVQEIHRRIKAAREMADRVARRQSLADMAGEGSGAAGRTDPLEEHVQALRHELTDIEANERELREVMDKELDQAKTLVDVEFSDDRYAQDIARMRQFHDSLLKQLAGLSLAKETGGYDARPLASARDGRAVEPKASLAFGLGGGLGLLLGLLMGYLAELTDKSFRSPEEIRRRLGLPLVGMVPALKGTDEGSPNGTALSPALCSYHQARSVPAEAFRGLRTSLFFSASTAPVKAVQVTSAGAGDGKSTVAANLAVSIAQARRNVLLIDADFRRPSQHRLFGLEARLGLASLIDGEADPVEVIRPSGVPGLAVLPAGPQPFNPAELLTLPRFKELLANLREQYDFVIVDTPPLLAVSDPLIVAPAMDGILLVVRPAKHGRPEAERAREYLVNVGANILGVVVNGVGEGGRRGRYDRYSGYGYEVPEGDGAAPEAAAAASRNGHASGNGAGPADSGSSPSAAAPPA